MSWLDNFKLQKDFSPQDLALMQMGASMMANQRQGFGAALGSGITAGLDEYARGMQLAEGTRHRKALEGLRQQGLNIQRTTVAQDQAQHDASLAQDEYLARQKKLHELSILNTQHDQNLALQDKQQDFDWSLTYQKHLDRLREMSADDLLKLHQGNKLKAETDMLEFQSQQLRDALRDQETAQAAESKITRGKVNPISEWFNKVSEPGSKQPDYTYRTGPPRSAWEGQNLERLRNEAEVYRTTHRRQQEMSKKKIQKAYEKLRQGLPLGNIRLDKFTKEEMKKLDDMLSR